MWRSQDLTTSAKQKIYRQIRAVRKSRKASNETLRKLQVKYIY